jgi:hypothetical protein
MQLHNALYHQTNQTPICSAEDKCMHATRLLPSLAHDFSWFSSDDDIAVNMKRWWPKAYRRTLEIVRERSFVAHGLTTYVSTLLYLASLTTTTKTALLKIVSTTISFPLYVAALSTFVSTPSFSLHVENPNPISAHHPHTTHTHSRLVAVPLKR